MPIQKYLRDQVGYAIFQIGQSFMEAGRVDEAIRQFTESLEICEDVATMQALVKAKHLNDPSFDSRISTESFTLTLSREGVFSLLKR